MLSTAKLFALVLYLVNLSSALPRQSRSRCKATDACWPSIEQWDEFNRTVSGRLITTRPSAAVCHSKSYDEAACKVAKQNWTISDWRTDQVGAYTGMLWEYGPNGQCFINTTIQAPCDQGYVPHYSVNATSVEDIQAAVKFASNQDLLLIVKNTGHDHLGRSSAGEGFSIWTHNMKGLEWHDDFVAHDAPCGVEGTPAVTVQPGEQWIDVYEAAVKQKRIVVGGHARTVGAAGGWLTGGGHSMWSNKYGLGIDNVLEMTVVDAKGGHIILNDYTNQDHFWAIRGGGGCAWGVITSITYQTHPEPSQIQAVFVQVNATDDESFRKAMSGSFRGINDMTAAGYTGYAYITKPGTGTPAYPVGFGALFVQPNGTDESYSMGTKGFFAMNEIEGLSAFALPLELPTWQAYISQFLTDPNIAQNVVDASRLLTSEVVYDSEREAALIDMIVEYGAGFNFIGRVKNDTRANTAVHPVWAKSLGILSFGTNWNDEASAEEKQNKRRMLVEQSRKLDEIYGPEGGTYINEANPFEPEWTRVFWGSNYERLLQIKQLIDPSNLFVCNRCVGSDVNFEP